MDGKVLTKGDNNLNELDRECGGREKNKRQTQLDASYELS